MKHLITKREAQVLHLIVYEYSTPEIAAKLHVSHHTARDHRKALLKKLNVKNSAGLVRKAFELGLETCSSTLRISYKDGVAV